MSLLERCTLLAKRYDDTSSITSTRSGFGPTIYLSEIEKCCSKMITALLCAGKAALPSGVPERAGENVAAKCEVKSICADAPSD
jgi:hypothetical protein